MFRAQEMPLVTELLSIARYNDFLAERRKLIAVRLNVFLGA
jgi:hypothetical protein